MRRYADRADAGRRLAGLLVDYAGRVEVVVLALPRGGVPVAVQVARRLAAPLDVLIVRKVGVPGHEELAMGAIALVAGTIETVRNPGVLAQLQRSPSDRDVGEMNVGEMDVEGLFERVAARERAELARRENAYRAGRPPLDVTGRTVLVVDDGLATGATMRAAVAVLARLHPSRIVVAVPVGSMEACKDLRAVADGVVCARTPVVFRGVGDAYRDFDQVGDDEVRLALAAR